MRRKLRTLHLYAGLIAVVYAAAIGISGAILVFEPELEVATGPEFLSDTPQQISTGPESVLKVVRSEFASWRPLSLTWPNTEAPHWMVYLLKGSESRKVYVDTQSLAIVGTLDPGAGWLGSVKRLHVSLSAGPGGRLANGLGALTLLCLSVTGVILWLPAKSFAWRFRELHYRIGIISALFVVALSFTGMYFVWPQTFVLAVDATLGRSKDRAVPRRTQEQKLRSLDVLAARAQAAVPEHRIFRMQIVDRSDQLVRVSLLEGTPLEFHRVSSLLLDPINGEVVKVLRLRDRPFGDSLLAWFSAIHFGVFGGWAVKIIWSLFGLSLPALSFTGLAIWLYKKRARKPLEEPEVLLRR